MENRKRRAFDGSDLFDHTTHHLRKKSHRDCHFKLRSDLRSCPIRCYAIHKGFIGFVSSENSSSNLGDLFNFGVVT